MIRKLENESPFPFRPFTDISKDSPFRAWEPRASKWIEDLDINIHSEWAGIVLTLTPNVKTLSFGVFNEPRGATREDYHLPTSHPIDMIFGRGCDFDYRLIPGLCSLETLFFPKASTKWALCAIPALNTLHISTESMQDPRADLKGGITAGPCHVRSMHIGWRNYPQKYSSIVRPEFLNDTYFPYLTSVTVDFTIFDQFDDHSTKDDPDNHFCWENDVPKWLSGLEKTLESLRLTIPKPNDMPWRSSCVTYVPDLFSCSRLKYLSVPRNFLITVHSCMRQAKQRKLLVTDRLPSSLEVLEVTHIAREPLKCVIESQSTERVPPRLQQVHAHFLEGGQASWFQGQDEAHWAPWLAAEL